MNHLDPKGATDTRSGFGAYDSYAVNTTCEWTNGNISSYRDLRSNRICTARYQFISFLPNLLFTFFSRLANTYLLIISIIIISDPNLSPYSLGIFLGPFVVSLIIYLLKEVLLDFNRKKSDEVYNDKLVKRGMRVKGGLEEVKWKDIETGDVIYLQNGELCPADIIILDTNLIKMKEAICFVDLYLMNGKTERIKKKASSLSNVISRNHQKNAYPQYRKVLTGKLDYEKPSTKLEHFFGLFKLKKDPKVERLSIENFIPRGAIIRNTGWIYGLVVYTGNQTKAYNRSNYSKMKISFLEKYSNAYFLAGLGIIFIITSISTVLYEAKYKAFFEGIGYRGGITSGERPFSFLTLYSPMIPFFLYLIIDLYNFSAKFRIENRLLNNSKGLCSSKKKKEVTAKVENNVAQPFLKINDPNPLSNFGQVEYVFLDKTGTLTKRSYRVTSIYFNNKVFEFEIDPKNVAKLKTANTGILSNDIEYPFLKQRDPSVKHDKNIDSKLLEAEGLNNINLGFGDQPQAEAAGKEGSTNPFENILLDNEFMNLIGKSNAETHFLLEDLMICHNASSTYLPKNNNYKYESDRKEEEAVLNFCSTNGFIFQRNLLMEQPPSFQIKLGPHPTQNTFKYLIVGTNEFTYKRGRFSVVFQNPLNQNNGDGYLVCKGPEESMRKIIDIDEESNEALDMVIKVYKDKGLKTILYAKRHLSKEQLKLYQTTLSNLKTSLICKEEEFDLLAETFEMNLELIAVVGLQDALKDGVVDCLQTFNDMNLKLWMVTGDEKENAINTAITSKMLSQHDEAMTISEVKKKDLRVMIKHHLEDIKNSSVQKDQGGVKEMKEMKESVAKSTQPQNNEGLALNLSLKNKFLVVNGKSLDVIMRDSFLKPHFIFLLALMKKVVAYNLRPEHKKILVNIVQTKFYGHPSVLAIGDGFNDTLMFQSASASIELVHKNEITGQYEVNTHTGDIQVSNFRFIPQLLLLDCKTHEQITEQLLYIFYSFSSYLITMIFLYNMYCYFSESALMPSYAIVILEILFLPTAFCFAVFQKPIRAPIMNKFPALYCDSSKKKETYPLLFLFKGLVEPFFQGLLVYFITSFTVYESLTNDGHPGGFKVLSSLMFVSIFTLMNIKLFSQSLANRNQITQIGFTLSISSMLLYLFFSGDMISNGFLEIFNSAQTILVFVLNILLNLLVTLIMSLVVRRFTPSLFEDFCNRAKTGAVTNNILKESIIPEIKLSTYIKKIFKKPEIIDPLIYDIISSSSGVKSNELKLNKWTLQIRDRNLEKKYKFSRKQKSLILSRTFFAMLLVMFGLYSILDFIKQGSSPSGFGKLAVFVVFLLLMAFTFSDYYLIFYQKFIIIFIVIPLIVKIAFDWVNIEENISHITVLVSIISTNPLHIDILKIIGINSLHIISYFFRSIVVMVSGSLADSEIIDKNDKSTLLDNYSLLQTYSESLSIVFNVIISAVCLYFNYTFEMGKRNEFLAKVKIDMEGSVRQDILSILVPKFVQDQLNQGNTSMQQDKEEVTILFCDICDFDKMVNAEGKKVVQLLDGLFRAYDTFCLQHGIQKIETVGKTYMAACGIKECEYGIVESISRVEKKRRIINLALEMLKHASKFTYGKGEKIKIKIGINTGKCIAGVIGYHKPQFSLIGDTVNTTSRLCSTGDDNSITISEAVFSSLKYQDLAFKKKVVEAKGKGFMTTYQLFQRKKDDDGVFRKKMGDALKAIKMKKITNPAANAHEAVFLKKMLDISENQKKKSMGLLMDLYNKAPEKIAKTTNEGKKSVVANKEPGQDATKATIEDDDEYIDDTNFSKQLLKHNKFFLNFPRHQHMLEAEFTQQLYDIYTYEGRIFFLILFLFYLLHTIVLIYMPVFSQSKICTILRGICCFTIMLSFFVYRHRKYFIKVQRILIIAFYLSAVIITLIQTNYSTIRASQNVLLLELMLIFLTYSSISIIQFREVFAVSFVSSLLWLILYWTLDILNLDYIFVFLTFQFFNIIKVYLHQRYHIKVFNNLRINESIKVEQESLVSQLLPYHVFEKLKNVDIDNKLGLTEEFNDVSILFADIAGFTSYSSSVTPDKVVDMLRNLFTEFDKMCIKFKIYKVYTIGDCYVALGFNNANKRKPVQEAKNLVKMGLSMIEIIRNVRRIINFKDLDMRIGIHSGSYIGGIIGTDIVRYDIYGQDVLIANKMESNGIEGNLLVSEATKKILEKDKNLPYKFEKVKEVICKGVEQPIPAYLIIQGEYPSRI